MIDGLIALAQTEPTISGRHVYKHIDQKANHDRRENRGATRHASKKTDQGQENGGQDRDILSRTAARFLAMVVDLDFGWSLNWL